MSKIKSEASKEASNHVLETNTPQTVLAGDSPEYAGGTSNSSPSNNSANSLHRAVNSISQAAYPASRLGLFHKAVRNSHNSNQTATRLARSYKAATEPATLSRTAAPGVLQRLAGAPPAWIGSLASTIAEHSGGVVSTGQVGSLLTTAWNSGTGAVSSVLTNLERFAVQAFEFIDLEGIIAMLAEGTEALVAGVLSIEFLPVAVAVIVVGGVAYLIVTDKNPWDLVNQYKQSSAPARPGRPAPASRPPKSASYDPYATTPSKVDLPDPATYNAPITIPEQPREDFHPRPAPKPYTNPALATRAWAKYKEGWDYRDKVLQNSQSEQALSQAFLDPKSIPSRTLAMLTQKLNDLEADLRIFDPYHNGEGGLGPQVEQAANRIHNTRLKAVDKAMQDMDTVLQQVRRHAQQSEQRNQQIATGEIPLSQAGPLSNTVNEGGVQVTTYSPAATAAAQHVYNSYSQGDQLVRQIEGNLSQLTGANQAQVALLQQHLPSLAQLDALVGQLDQLARQNRGMGWFSTEGNPHLAEMIPVAHQIDQLIPQVQREKQNFDRQISTAGLQSLLTGPATQPNPLPPTMPPQHIPQTEPQADSTIGGGQGGNTTGGRIGGGTNGPNNNNKGPGGNPNNDRNPGVAVNIDPLNPFKHYATPSQPGAYDDLPPRLRGFAANVQAAEAQLPPTVLDEVGLSTRDVVENIRKLEPAFKAACQAFPDITEDMLYGIYAQEATSDTRIYEDIKGTGILGSKGPEGHYLNNMLPMRTNAKNISDSQLGSIKEADAEWQKLNTHQKDLLEQLVTSQAGGIMAAAQSLHHNHLILFPKDLGDVPLSDPAIKSIIAGTYGPTGIKLPPEFNGEVGRLASIEFLQKYDSYGKSIVRIGHNMELILKGESKDYSSITRDFSAGPTISKDQIEKVLTMLRAKYSGH